MDEQVRHEQQPLCPAPQLRRLLFYCHQLEQRVDGHDLIARCLIKRSGVHCAQRLLHHSGSAAVAVVHRVFQQGPVFVQQAKIHTPGIEADAVDRARLSQPCAHLIHCLLYTSTKPIQVTVMLPLLLAISFSRNDDIHSSISGISNDLIGVIPTIGQ